MCLIIPLLHVRAVFMNSDMLAGVLKHVIYDVIRGRLVIAFGLFMLVTTCGMIYLSDDSAKAVISMLNILLIVIPLISIVTAAIHYYNSLEFMELLMTQPVRRRVVFFAEYLGITSGLVIALTAGMGIPLLVWYSGMNGMLLLLTGVLLTVAFTAMAFLCVTHAMEKTRGIGLVLIAWFFTTILYDALLLLVLYRFSDYPLEKFMLVFTSLNPVDLARVMVMLQTDTAALMGYTGAVYNKYLGSQTGIITGLVLLSAWAAIPVLISSRRFTRRDF